MIVISFFFMCVCVSVHMHVCVCVEELSAAPSMFIFMKLTVVENLSGGSALEDGCRCS